MRTFRTTRFAVPLGALLLVFAGAQYLFPNSGIFATWSGIYPNSTTGNAGCQVCHGPTTATLNAYGNAVRPGTAAAIQAAANLNSDNDSGGSSNLAEINAGAQPGWTTGSSNLLFSTSSGAGAGTAAAPSVVPAPLDPAVAPPPQAPEINLTSMALEFGAVTVGSSQTRTTTVQNLGNANLVVSSVTVSGNPDFMLDSTTPARPITVPAGGSANIVVRYAPSAAGDDTATLNIVSNDSNEGSLNVTLHGTGTPVVSVCDINVTPLTRAFGSVNVGESSTLDVTVGNTGTGACSVTALTVSPAEFALGASVPARPFSVQPGASVQVLVSYTPANTGSDNGTLVVASNDPAKASVTIALTGTGVSTTPPPACNIQVSQSALNFGGVPIGSSATRSTTITNTGGASCTVNSVAITSGGSEFTIGAALPALPLTLVAGEAVQVSVGYMPSNAGDDAGTLTIGTSDPDQPTVTVSLVGSGVAVQGACDIQVARFSISFGSVEIGNSRSLSAAISNAGGGACNVSWQLGPGGSGEFSLGSSAASTTLAPGSTATIQIAYSPTNAGNDAGTLLINSNDPNEAQIPVALTGSGFSQAQAVDLEVVRFSVPERFEAVRSRGDERDEHNSDGDNEGRFRLGPAAITISVTVQNNGSVNEPRTATVTGTQNGAVVYNQSLAVSAPAGSRRSFIFPSFVPTAEGVIQWSLVIATDVAANSTAQATTQVMFNAGSTGGGDDHGGGDGGGERSGSTEHHE